MDELREPHNDTDDLPFSDPPLTDEEADALLAAEMGEREEEGEGEEA